MKASKSKKNSPEKSKKLAGSTGSLSALWFDPEKLKIVTDPLNSLFDERACVEPSDEMIANVNFLGIIEPVIVQKNVETGEVEVVAGRQRVKAAIRPTEQRKKQGLELLRVPVMPKRGLGVSELMAVMVSENEQPRDDDPTSKARKMQRYLDTGRSLDDAAILWGVSTSSIKNQLSLLEGSRQLQKAVSSGKVKASAAYKLSKLEPEEQKVKLAQIESVSEKPGKVRRKKTREIVEGVPSLRGKKEIEECLTMIENSDDVREQDRQICVWTLRWVLGEETLARFVGEKRETGT